jgi:hypothetical protein
MDAIPEAALLTLTQALQSLKICYPDQAYSDPLTLYKVISAAHGAGEFEVLVRARDVVSHLHLAAGLLRSDAGRMYDLDIQARLYRTEHRKPRKSTLGYVWSFRATTSGSVARALSAFSAHVWQTFNEEFSADGSPQGASYVVSDALLTDVIMPARSSQ